MQVHVHPRVMARHPEIAASDAVAAFEGTLRKAKRTDTDPAQWVGVGLDQKGRLLEYGAIEVGPDEWLLFHAMKATPRVLIETGMRRR